MSDVRKDIEGTDVSNESHHQTMADAGAQT
jgi:hypothetical protein